MNRLTDYRIYILPGSQRSLYLVSNEKEVYLLYDCEFGSRLPPRFRVAANGNISNWFDDFPIWTTADLIDTGEDYKI